MIMFGHFCLQQKLLEDLGKYRTYAYNKDYYKNKLNNKKYTRRRTLKIYKN